MVLYLVKCFYNKFRDIVKKLICKLSENKNSIGEKIFKLDFIVFMI